MPLLEVVDAIDGASLGSAGADAPTQLFLVEKKYTILVACDISINLLCTIAIGRAYSAVKFLLRNWMGDQ